MIVVAVKIGIDEESSNHVQGLLETVVIIKAIVVESELGYQSLNSEGQTGLFNLGMQPSKEKEKKTQIRPGEEWAPPIYNCLSSRRGSARRPN